MYRIALVNMPFAPLERPSLALTQLRSLVQGRFRDAVSVEIHYLNQEFARLLGSASYLAIGESGEAQVAGVGEWIFRQLAFPDAEDNSYDYFRRYFSGRSEEVEALKFAVLEKRRGIERWLQRTIRRYALDRADLVGFTSMFAQNASTFGVARLLKERNPDLTVVLGGANCESPMGQEIVKNVPHVDFVFSGPALVSFPELVGRRLAGDDEACHRIAGVLSRENLSGRYPVPRSIGDELPIEVEVPLDYDDFFAALETNLPELEKKPCVLFETSRGCWWGERSHCRFCGLNGTTLDYRSMPPQRAVAQLQDLFARYGDVCDFFESVDNILPRSYLTEVLPHLSPPPNATVFYEVKADLREEEMGRLVGAGVTKVQPGIESLSTSTLKLIKKGTTAFINLKFLRSCCISGVSPLWNILVGFPLEEDDAVFEKYLADIPRLVHLPPPGGVTPIIFQRYSPYFELARDYGLDLRPAEYYHYAFPFSDEVLRDMAYYFTDVNRAAPYAQVAARWMHPLQEAVDAWRRRWSGTDGGLQAELFLTEGGGVHDTRTGEEVTHRIEPVELEVLRRLERAQKPSRLARRLEELDAARLEGALRNLEDLGLVFREEDQLMSLVLPGPTHAAARAA